MRRRLLIVLAAAAVSLITAQTAFGLLSATPVKTGPADQFYGVGSGTWIAWTQIRRASGAAVVFVQNGSSPRVRVNARGSAVTGGFDGTNLVYQRIRRGQSDLRLYDAATATRTSLPASVNTRYWEYWPTMSSGWMLFGRENFRHNPPRDRVILFNLGTSEKRVLDERAGRTHLQPGQVNTDFAVWNRPVHGGYTNVRRYQISTSTTIKLPRPTGKLQYGASVAADGRVFYARSSTGCGNHVVLREWAPAPTPIDTALIAMPRGFDAGHTYFDESTSTLYYTRYNCARHSSNIYKVVIP